nr:2-C-methyl-D-erythritol 4-phosphate cytidylyltransferase [Hyphomonadaceae bacterium]
MSANAALLIVAGGSGTRFGASQAKQYLPLAGLPVLAWSVRTGLSHSDIAQVVVVHPSGDGAQIATILQAAGVNPADVLLCVGGATRTHSVRAGLAALLASGLEDQRQAPPSSILIHDAARPGLDHEVIDRLLAALEHSDAAVPVLEMADALWDADQTLLLGPVN